MGPSAISSIRSIDCVRSRVLLSWKLDSKAVGNVEYYTPTSNEMAQWRQAAAKAWVVSKRMKLYDTALARRVLATQDGLKDFMKELEKLGAL